MAKIIIMYVDNINFFLFFYMINFKIVK